MGIFQRMRGRAARDGGTGAAALAQLGGAALAVRLDAGTLAPAACMMLRADPAGRVRTDSSPMRAGEVAWCVHPGPYRCAVQPYAAAPELGLTVDFYIDPQSDLGRFGLLLAGECRESLALADFCGAAQLAIQGALQQGALELPPCTTDEEWRDFRAGLNELMFTRFGVIVDDCVPTDLHPSADYAEALRSAAALAPAPAPVAPPARAEHSAASAPPAGAGPGCESAVAGDALALRRLFLELPALSAGIRALGETETGAQFSRQQAILSRLALATLDAGTMPALALAAPGEKLSKPAQERRASYAIAARQALDESWATLARLRCASSAAAWDEADRAVANLEQALGRRRKTAPGEAA